MKGEKGTGYMDIGYENGWGEGTGYVDIRYKIVGGEGLIY